MPDDLTLSNLFDMPRLQFSGAVSDLVTAEAPRALRELLALRAASSGLKFVSGEVCAKLAEQCDQISIIDMLANIWNQYQMLDEYTDKEKYPPGKTSSAILFDHDVESDQHITVEVSAVPLPPCNIDFRIAAGLTIKGIALKIENGCIHEVLAGSLEGEGTISAGPFQLVRKKIDAITLPGRVRLKQPIPIRSHSAA